MSKFEKFGSITFSPTAVTDKEEVHGLHKRAEGSASGGGLFVCTLRADENENYTCDRTLAEIVEAFKAGNTVIMNSDGYLLHPIYIGEGGGVFNVVTGGYEINVTYTEDGIYVETADTGVYKLWDMQDVLMITGNYENDPTGFRANHNYEEIRDILNIRMVIVVDAGVTYLDYVRNGEGTDTNTGASYSSYRSNSTGLEVRVYTDHAEMVEIER